MNSRVAVSQVKYQQPRRWAPTVLTVLATALVAVFSTLIVVAFLLGPLY